MKVSVIEEIKRAAGDFPAFARVHFRIKFRPSGAACCPRGERHNHGDRDPSLKLTPDRQAAMCWSQHCFGDRPIDIIAFYAAMKGISQKEAVGKLARFYRVVKLGASHRTVRRIYAYPDYRHVIVEPYSCQADCGCEKGDKRHRLRRKPFWERKTNGGTYVKGLTGVVRLPYRLKELRASEGKDVSAVESLQDVDTLLAMGFRAISMHDPWPKEWFRKYFGNEKVALVVLPDKDTAGLKQGERFALRAQKSGVFHSVRWAEPPAGWSPGFDASKAVRILRWTRANFKRLTDSAEEWTEPKKGSNQDGKLAVRGSEEAQRRSSQADELIALAEASGIELFHDQFSDPWACVPFGERQEIVRIRGRFFQRFLARISWQAQEKAPSSETLRAALNVLEAKAIFDGKRHDLYVRLAWHEGALWYDLGSSAVRITAQGWQIVDKPPILFRRFPGQRPQCLPERGGSITKVLDFVNLPGNQPKDTRLLFTVHLVASCIPDVPRPIFQITGTKGSAKTTLGRVVQRIVDPNEKDVLAFPDSPREFIQTLAHHYFVVFDNLGQLPKWASDALCRAVTGAGFSKRELYTDDDDILYSFKRAIALNSIWSVAAVSDLLDRCVIYQLPDLGSHESEEAFWARFEAEKPLLLGGLFDTLSAAISHKAELRSVPIRARMADFALWGMTIAKALGAEPEEFLAALAENSRISQGEAIQASPVGICLLKMLEQHEESWMGSSTQLLTKLKEFAASAGVDERSLPRDASWLSRRLKELAKDLEVCGWKVHLEHSGDRRISICRGEDAENGVHGVHSGPEESSLPSFQPGSYGDPSERDSMDTISPLFTSDEEVSGEEVI